MKSVRYRKARSGVVRILRTQDLDRLGIKHKGQDLTWNQANNFTVVMNNQMSDSLVEKLPGDFDASDAEGEDETPEVQEVMTSLASSGTGSDMDLPESSVSSGASGQQASTPKASKKS